MNSPSLAVLNVTDRPLKLTPADVDLSSTHLSTQPKVDLESYISTLERFSVLSNENIELKSEINALKQKLKTNDHLDGLIQPYAARAFWFMSLYCGFVALILILQGFHIWTFTLTDSVTQIIVGSTAVTVIGLVGMVLTGIFVGARQR